MFLYPKSRPSSSVLLKTEMRVSQMEMMPSMLLLYTHLYQVASSISCLLTVPGLSSRITGTNEFIREPGINSQPGGPVQQPYLLYRLARLHRLAIPGLLKRLQIRAQATLASGIGSLESIPGLHNKKNEDEDNFFWIQAKKNEYI